MPWRKVSFMWGGTAPQTKIEHGLCTENVLYTILSVAVVEFGIHTLRYWSETFHGVSIYGVLKNLSYFNCFWSNIVKFSGDTVVGYHCWYVDNILKKEVISTCNFTTNSDSVCFIIHSKGNLSLRGVTWNSRNWPIRFQPVTSLRPTEYQN